MATTLDDGTAANQTTGTHDADDTTITDNRNYSATTNRGGHWKRPHRTVKTAGIQAPETDMDRVESTVDSLSSDDAMDLLSFSGGGAALDTRPGTRWLAHAPNRLLPRTLGGDQDAHEHAHHSRSMDQRVR